VDMSWLIEFLFFAAMVLLIGWLLAHPAAKRDEPDISGTPGQSIVTGGKADVVVVAVWWIRGMPTARVRPDVWVGCPCRLGRDGEGCPRALPGHWWCTIAVPSTCGD